MWVHDASPAPPEWDVAARAAWLATLDEAMRAEGQVVPKSIKKTYCNFALEGYTYVALSLGHVRMAKLSLRATAAPHITLAYTTRMSVHDRRTLSERLMSFARGWRHTTPDHRPYVLPHYRHLRIQTTEEEGTETCAIKHAGDC